MMLGRQGRLVIPARLRQEMELNEGDRLSLHRDGDRLVIVPQRREAEALRGMFSHLAKDRSVVDELIADRRAEARRESEA